jgi:MFS family permease
MRQAAPVSDVVLGRQASPSVGFWLVGYLFAAGMLGTTLPTPLYILYQGQWHFATETITFIFATYAVGVIAALLFAGQVSDEIGRRPVLFAALGLSAASSVVFIFASATGWLFLGRILSGFSAGLLTGTCTAALTDLSPGSPRRASVVSTVANMGGLGLGALVAGLFAQYGPDPTVLVFEVYLALIAVAALGLLAVPETVAERRRLSLRFRGLGIPDRGRSEFLAASLAGFSAFTLLGLFTSLVPSFLGGVLHEHNLAVAGAAVFLVFATATVTQVVIGRRDSTRLVVAALGGFLVALALIVLGLSEASLGIFLAGAVVGGVAVGAVFLGSLTTANRLAPPEFRGRVVSSYFLLCYIGLTVPVIAVGISSQHVGDFRATLVCAVVLSVLCVYSAVVLRRATTAARLPIAGLPGGGLPGGGLPGGGLSGGGLSGGAS